MEAYVGYLFLTVLGLVLALLIRSITKMYERLWNGKSSASKNPEEEYQIMVEAINTANKLSEDRARKRVNKVKEPTPEDIEEAMSTSPVPTDLQGIVEALYKKYQDLEAE